MTIRLCSYYPNLMAFLQSALQTRIDLSPREMLAISRAISREFAPRFARSDAECPTSITFSAKELLSISQEISREFSPRPIENRSSLVLLPIDPRRLHAYWHLAEHSLRVASKPIADEPKSVVDQPKPVVEEQLTLRIFTQSNSLVKTTGKPEAPSWFDIPINNAQIRQDIVLPADADATSKTYTAALGVRHGDHDFNVFAYSNTAAIPNSQSCRRDNTTLSDVIAQFIMPNMNASSSIGKAASNPDKGSR